MDEDEMRPKRETTAEIADRLAIRLLLQESPDQGILAASRLIAHGILGLRNLGLSKEMSA